MADAVRKAGVDWTVGALAVGLALAAACLVVPQVEENRRVRVEAARLAAELERMDEQVSLNATFLEAIGTDASLAERLAQRQLNLVREGTAVLELAPTGGAESQRVWSGTGPFQLLAVGPPARVPAGAPVGGVWLAWAREPRPRLYLTGLALFLVAVGLTLDGRRRGYDAADAGGAES